MTITFTTKIAVGDVGYAPISYLVDYDLKEKDLIEYAKKSGFKSVNDYLEYLVDGDGETLAEMVKEQELDLYEIAFEIEYIKTERECFKRFITNKYQHQFENWLFEKLSDDDERDLIDASDFIE